MSPASSFRAVKFSEPHGRQSFGELRNYSRFVGLMKFGLVTLAVALLGVFLAWPGTNDDPQEFRLSYAKIDASDLNQLGMVNARYIGTDEENRQYMVTADSAMADPGDQTLVRLKALQAEMTQVDQTWVTVLADHGIYDIDDKTLVLSKEVNLFSDSGYEFHTQDTRVDLESGSATSDSPIIGQGPFGTLRADSFRLADRGSRMFFEGSVHVTIYINSERTDGS